MIVSPPTERAGPLFSIPSPGDPDSTERLLDWFSDEPEVTRVYMGLPALGTGRATVVHVDVDTVESVAEACDSHDVDLEIVMNPLCTAEVVSNRDGFSGFERTLSELDDAGVEHLVLSDPLLIRAALERGFHVSVSCVSEVNTPRRARYYDELGVDEITLDTNVNRRLDVVEAIAGEVSARLRIIVNEGCLPDCPYRPYHFCLFSHATRSEAGVVEDSYYVRCVSERLNNPTLLVQQPFVRPEDVDEYRRLGVDSFKIAGRANSTRWIRRAVRAYLQRRYDGNLLDILDCPTTLRHLVHLDNRELDGLLERAGRCDQRCSECGFCERLAERAVSYRGGLTDAGRPATVEAD